MSFLPIKHLFSPNFNTFLKEDLSLIDTSLPLYYLLPYLLLSFINMIVLQLNYPNRFDTVISIMISSIAVALLLLLMSKTHRKLLSSTFILSLQILTTLQYEETYLKRLYSPLIAYPFSEVKLLLTLLLYSCENSLNYKLLTITIQLILSAILSPSYQTPWLYIAYGLLTYILLFQELQARSRMLASYDRKKQLQTWVLLMDKVLPFGYMILGRNKEATNEINLIRCNEFMCKIFELDFKDYKMNEKLLEIFKVNHIKKMISSISLEEKQQKPILNYIIDKLNKPIKQLGKKMSMNVELDFIEEIIQQEIIYQEGKAKALDIFFLRVETNGGETSIMVLINDISDRVLNYKLTNLDRFKDRFLQSVSHNLKTPLNSITGLVSLMNEIVLNTEALQYLSNIKVNSDILLFEINNMLDYANYKKSSLKPKIEHFSLPHLINELLPLFELSIYEKKLRFQKKIKLSTEQQFLISDSYRLKQVLYNLLSNAFKFTFEGEVTISLSRPKNISIYNDILKISIKDTGIGISKPSQDKLFHLWGSLNDSFVAGEAETINARNGAGLGLTISKHLIGILGPEERIFCKSTLGKGSVFFFYLYQNLRVSEGFHSNNNRKRVEMIPSYDSLSISFNRLTLNSQFMLGSLGFLKNDPLGNENNFTGYLNNIKSKNTLKRNSIIKMKKETKSPSNFSPKVKKNSIYNEDSKKNEEVFDESDCRVNEVYLDKPKKSQYKLKDLLPLPFKINLINIDERASLKEISEISKKSSELKEGNLPFYQKKPSLSLKDYSLSQKDLENSFLPTVNKAFSKEILPKKRTVLIVDDTPFNVLVLEKFLKDLDPEAQILKAFNGKEAVLQYKSFAEGFKRGLDLILMDCNMPVMDGYEASIAIKNLGEEKGFGFTAIIAITAYSGKDEEEKCYKSKMDDYIGKPVNREKFGVCYWKWIKGNRIID